jgi:hypothetical protein
VLRLFLKPKEVVAMCKKNGLDLVEMVGSRPRFGRAFWRMLRTGEVPVDLSFKFTPSTVLAFNGFARKPSAPAERPCTSTCGAAEPLSPASRRAPTEKSWRESRRRSRAGNRKRSQTG